jgi:alpha-glucosidase
MWLDIDYMNGWRVFSWDQRHFPDSKRQQLFDRLRDHGHRIVTIVDPGIKKEPGNPIFDEFSANNLLCTNEEGVPYTGTVWPGATVFPDFGLEDARTRWANHIAQWAHDGIDGIWNDMNDPSTGPITDEEMRFLNGTLPHHAGHNAYANLMAQATFDGLMEARPDQRPFILTRSGMTGIQSTAAVWTGDNFSNVTHLKMSIPQTLNLGLSGVAFNGPDVGGFCDHTTEDLMVAWTMCGFLFPFFRNHSASNTRQQEPYMFGTEAESTIRRCIQTRLKLMPLLDALFAQHAAAGDPVMRPLCYEFPEDSYARVEDQYLLGSALLAAPFLDPATPNREVVLPPGAWLQLSSGEWHQGPTTITIQRTSPDQPVLFLRDGSIIPTWQGSALPGNGEGDGALDLHVFLRDAPSAQGTLVEDDGITRHGPVCWRDLSYQILPTGHGRLQVVAHSLGYAHASKSVRLLFHGLAPVDAIPQEDTWPFHQRTLSGLIVTLPA